MFRVRRPTLARPGRRTCVQFSMPATVFVSPAILGGIVPGTGRKVYAGRLPIVGAYVDKTHISGALT